MASFKPKQVYLYYFAMNAVLFACISPCLSTCSVLGIVNCSCVHPNLDCSSKLYQKIPVISDKSFTRIVFKMNEIKVISNEHFRGFSQLYNLDLSSNVITHIEEDSFWDLTKLNNLCLNHNRLLRLESAHFARVSNLQVLSLSGNEYLTFDPCLLSTLPSLTTVTLQETKIDLTNDLISVNADCLLKDSMMSEGVTGKFRYVSTLRSLSVGHSGTVSDALLLENFTSLQLLAIFAFPEESLSGVNISSLTQLRDLTLHSVTVYPKDFLVSDSLTTLHIVNAKFLCLPEKAFYNVPSLQSLVITRNELTWLHRSAFFGAKSLAFINLSNNRLVSLPSGIFDSIGNSTFFPQLVLSGNQLICDCHLKWFQEFLVTDIRLTKYTQSTPLVFCHSPVAFFGRPLVDVDIKLPCDSHIESIDDTICRRIWPRATSFTSTPIPRPIYQQEEPQQDLMLIYFGILVSVLLVIIIVIIVIALYVTNKNLSQAAGQYCSRDTPRVRRSSIQITAPISSEGMNRNNRVPTVVYDNPSQPFHLDQFHESDRPNISRTRQIQDNQMDYSMVTVDRAANSNPRRMECRTSVIF